MPTRKKLRDLTTDEALKRLFPKRVVGWLKQTAQAEPGKKPSPPSSRPSRPKPSR